MRPSHQNYICHIFTQAYHPHRGIDDPRDDKHMYLYNALTPKGILDRWIEQERIHQKLFKNTLILLQLIASFLLCCRRRFCRPFGFKFSSVFYSDFNRCLWFYFACFFSSIFVVCFVLVRNVAIRLREIRKRDFMLSWTIKTLCP